MNLVINKSWMGLGEGEGTAAAFFSLILQAGTTVQDSLEARTEKWCDMYKNHVVLMWDGGV